MFAKGDGERGSERPKQDRPTARRDTTSGCVAIGMSNVLTAGGTDITPMIVNLCAKSAQRKDVANTPERNALTQNDGRLSSAGEVDALRQEDVDKHRSCPKLIYVFEHG